MLKSIAVTPAYPPEIAPNGTLQLTATGTYSSGPTQNLTGSAIWNSSNTTVATVSAGLVKCQTIRTHYDGTATISATSGAVKGSVTVTCEEQEDR